MKFLRDLFAGPENSYWDLGRILGSVAFLSMIGGAVWNIMLGRPIDLGPTGFGGGLAAVVGATAALVYAKDRARTEATVAHAVATPAPCPSEPPKRAPARKAARR
jgi:hypothetical protein